MKKRNFVRFAIPLLLATFLLFLVPSGSARTKTRKPPATITDAAGRVHVRPAAKITDAQRKAAAKHRKAVRDKARQSNVPNVKKAR
jgi:hypothetical protein